MDWMVGIFVFLLGALVSMLLMTSYFSKQLRQIKENYADVFDGYQRRIKCYEDINAAHVKYADGLETLAKKNLDNHISSIDAFGKITQDCLADTNNIDRILDSYNSNKKIGSELYTLLKTEITFLHNKFFEGSVAAMSRREETVKSDVAGSLAYEEEHY